MVWSLCYLVYRCMLQLVLLRPRSEEFKELEIVVLRHELSVLRRQTRRPQLTATDRVFLAAASRLLVELAIVLRHADNTPPLASPPRRQTLDVRRSRRSAADRQRDPGVSAAAGAREPALGISAHRRRTARARDRGLRDNCAQAAAPSAARPRRRAFRPLLACVSAGARGEHDRGRLLHC